MATIGDGFKDIFLAGVGAMAITGEKAKELVDTLISKGELTVDQGRQINTELKHKATEAAEAMRFDALEARMSVMTPEERSAFAAKAAEIASRPQAQQPCEQEPSPEPGAQAAEQPAEQPAAAEEAPGSEDAPQDEAC